MTIQRILRQMAAAENHDGEPWDTMQVAAECIDNLSAQVAELQAEVQYARGMAEQNDQWEYIGVLEDKEEQQQERISALEAALVNQTARAIHAERYMHDEGWPYPLERIGEPDWQDYNGWAQDDARVELANL